MRSMKGEVSLNLPAEKAWQMYRDNEVVSKINPELLSRAEYVQGDGGPGTLRLFKLGPGIFLSQKFLFQFLVLHILAKSCNLLFGPHESMKRGSYGQKVKGKEAIAEFLVF